MGCHSGTDMAPALPQQQHLRKGRTMASLTALSPKRSCRTHPHHSLLLLLFSFGWAQPLRAQAGESRQAASLDPVLANVSSFTSLSPDRLLGFTCADVSGLSPEHVKELAMAVGQKNATLQADQLRCLAHGLPAHLAPEDLDAFPPDLLLFLNPAEFSGPQTCAHFFSHISKANVDVLPRRSPERQRLLLAALVCRGVQGSQVSEADVLALGGLACDLPGCFVADSAAALLPRLAGCPGSLDQDQQEAAQAVLQGRGPPYGSPSKWSVSTLNTLQGLLPILDQDFIQDIPKGVVTAWLQRIYRNPSGPRPELTVVLPRLRRDTEKEACPPGREAHVVDEKLVFYSDRELEACVDGALLVAQIDHVNAVPFTYQQLNIFKRKLDKIYPKGYPESLIQRLGYFFLTTTPKDIHKWNVTSLQVVKDLLRVSKGRDMDAQVTTSLGGMWHKAMKAWGAQQEATGTGDIAGGHRAWESQQEAMGTEGHSRRLCKWVDGYISSWHQAPPSTGGCPDCPVCEGKWLAGQGQPGCPGCLPPYLPLLLQFWAAGLRATQHHLVSPQAVLGKVGICTGAHSLAPRCLPRAVRPQDLNTCSQTQLDILYARAHLTFQNVSRAEYFVKIQPFLGGAPIEDLQALSQQNVSMDLATFKTLKKEAVVGLTVREVQNLLGPHVGGLTAEQRNSPVWDWILRQRQDDLDAMGLGLQGGIPNGYLILDRSRRVALSDGHRLPGSRPMLSAVLALLLALALH
ncbi:mesothelin isoform X2 [Nycticebus coucang]|uniref:mesothelin isoform X2 n=1 Tax=Nycticebus coucang TaxID=9470 RepID=UPI00234CED98|nr:mesothelin isoform X2 [Nycticebus coucang]